MLPPRIWGSHTPDDGQGKDGDGARSHGWACPRPAEQPRFRLPAQHSGPSSGGHQSADGVASVGTRCPSAFPAKPSLFCEGSCVFRATACSQELGTATL